MDNKTKYTPGPWKAFLDKKPYAVGPENRECESQRLPLGHVFRSHVKGHEGQHEANAHLIAASPDMFKALETVMKSFAPRGTDGLTSKQSLAIGRVMNALAKAKGELR